MFWNKKIREEIAEIQKEIRNLKWDKLKSLIDKYGNYWVEIDTNTIYELKNSVISFGRSRYDINPYYSVYSESRLKFDMSLDDGINFIENNQGRFFHTELSARDYLNRVREIPKIVEEAPPKKKKRRKNDSKTK